MLTVHYSNDLASLAEALASVARTPVGSPFSPEIVIVQSRGVARWLSLRLADHGGVCANVRFPFPNAYAWELYRAVLRDVPEASAFEPNILTWRILGLLPGMEASPQFTSVRNYVAGDPFRRYELAVRLAGLFDQYLVYRPDWIAKWEKGGEEHWQAILWRELAREAPATHRARLHAQLLERLRSGSSGPAADLPERISMFGAPALPPSLLELFDALGCHTDVHLFIQNPCREYWGDIRAAGDIARKALENEDGAALLDVGNGLLASLGKQGRDFFDLATEIETAETDECFRDPAEQTLLGAIQSDVLNLRDRTPPAAVADGDRSLQFHACHSAMREVEVLHDQLLALFSEHRDLEPSDVVVMAPDIEKYAPYVDAVFGTTDPRIPFNVSDRSAQHESTLASTFIALLDLAGSRYDANRVLAILDEVAVRRRFGLAEGDLNTITRWVRDAQIRWGIDASHRARLGLPATNEHTWRFGLERLLLGYALPAGHARLFENILSYDEIEGSLGETLGRFQSFAAAAIALDAQLSPLRSLASWAELLHQILERFFDPPEDREYELEAVRSAVSALQADARAARFGTPVPLSVVKSALRERLEVPGRAFLSGGVTFCAMVPMRSLPFEVVCMIGMNDGAFPRVQRPFGFDLMARDLRKGDRSRRDDDRYLFLESLLCARRSLYVSYTGRNIRDDSVIPPSVLVSELLDYIAEHFRSDGDTRLRDRLVTVHPLQAFSRRYFGGRERLFSYSEDLRNAAVLAGTGRREPEPFIVDALPHPEEDFHAIELESLLRFYRNPARHLLRERLNIRLETAEEEIEAREPFELAPLANYGLKQRLLKVGLRDEAEDVIALERAAGVLPHGRMGEIMFERERDAVARFVARVAPALRAQKLDPIAFDIEVGTVRLTGVLQDPSPDGLLAFRAANVTANDRVSAWIRHLVLNIVAPKGVALETRCIGQDRILTFGPVKTARATLEALIDLYFQGLRRPLHFFPRSASVYAEVGEINSRVRNVWEGSPRSEDPTGERDNPYFRLAFRGLQPLDQEFERTARIVFEPMRDALTEETLG